MAVEFYGLVLEPNKAYKMSVPEHVELQINQVCLAPDSKVRPPASLSLARRATCCSLARQTRTCPRTHRESCCRMTTTHLF